MSSTTVEKTKEEQRALFTKVGTATLIREDGKYWAQLDAPSIDAGGCGAVSETDPVDKREQAIQDAYDFCDRKEIRITAWSQELDSLGCP